MSQPSLLHAEIENTKHNLSASGPGPHKSSSTTEICIFCHTPHSGIQSQALWNQEMPSRTYTPYSSDTLYSHPGQPTGSSRLCLSCHDGTTAMGSLRVPPSGGSVTLDPMQGENALGTDLSDDHPISFVYDTALVLQQGGLIDPSTQAFGLPLDATKQLQCTTCHDPHKNWNPQGLFLRRVGTPLCTSCHVPHQSAPMSWHYDCSWCHYPHNAVRGAQLLAAADVGTLCNGCHVYLEGSTALATGTMTTAAMTLTSSATTATAPRRAAKSLATDFSKASVHPIRLKGGGHTSTEDPATMPRHVTCVDCHDAHQTGPVASAGAPATQRLTGVRGVDISGTSVREIKHNYEVCLKCHGLTDQTTAGVVRQESTRNVRVQLNPANASYHPVAAMGKHATIQGLQPGYTALSLMECTDCHNSDDRTNGVGNSTGPHGSRFAPILAREYRQDDPVDETFQSAALCYQCHNRNTLLSTGPFPHRRHLQDARASCAACHDAHGSRANIRLINFMLRDITGKAVVERNAGGVLNFSAAGDGHGECNLSCHGSNHAHAQY